MLRTQLEASWATHSFPIAGELEGALADWLGEGLVRRDGVEPFALRFGLVSQPVDQTQRLSRPLSRAFPIWDGRPKLSLSRHH